MSNSHVINSHGSTVLILIVGNTGSSGRLYSAETAETATAITVRVVCVGPVARTEVQRTSCQKKSVDRILACTVFGYFCWDFALSLSRASLRSWCVRMNPV